MRIVRVHPYGSSGVKCTVCGTALESATDPETEMWTGESTLKEFIKKMNKEHYMMKYAPCDEYIVAGVQCS